MRAVVASCFRSNGDRTVNFWTAPFPLAARIRSCSDLTSRDRQSSTEEDGPPLPTCLYKPGDGEGVLFRLRFKPILEWLTVRAALRRGSRTPILQTSWRQRAYEQRALRSRRQMRLSFFMDRLNCVGSRTCSDPRSRPSVAKKTRAVGARVPREGQRRRLPLPPT